MARRCATPSSAAVTVEKSLQKGPAHGGDGRCAGSIVARTVAIDIGVRGGWRPLTRRVAIDVSRPPGRLLLSAIDDLRLVHLGCTSLDDLRLVHLFCAGWDFGRRRFRFRLG